MKKTVKTKLKVPPKSPTLKLSCNLWHVQNHDATEAEKEQRRHNLLNAYFHDHGYTEDWNREPLLERMLGNFLAGVASATGMITVFGGVIAYVLGKI